MDAHRRPPRRLSLLDGLILLVPIALGFALVRGFLTLDQNPVNLTRSPGRTGYVARNVLGRCASMAMLGALAVRLRRPRPALRRLARQPGFVASVAGTAAMAAGGAISLSLAASRMAWTHQGQGYWPDVEGHIGPAVIAAWAALAWSGRWRSEPSWIDRYGRLLGLCWVLLAPLPWIFGLITPWLPAL